MQQPPIRRRDRVFRPERDEFRLKRREVIQALAPIQLKAITLQPTRIKTCWMLQICIGHAAKGFDCSCVQRDVISVQVKNCTGAYGVGTSNLVCGTPSHRGRATRVLKTNGMDI